jgi:hypothetical protein
MIWFEERKIEMTYTGEMALPKNCVAMQEDEMMYTEGGAQVYWAYGGINVQLTGAETRAFTNGATDILANTIIIGIAGAIPIAGVAAYAIYRVYRTLLLNYNSNNSGVRFYWSPLQIALGPLNTPLVFDNY